MIVPFLELLFSRTQLVLEKPAYSLTADYLTNYFNYFFSNLIQQEGKTYGLIFLSLMVIVMFLLKNFFKYAALYILAPVRSRIVMDIRNDLFKKMLILPLSYYTERKRGDILSRMTSDVQEIETSIIGSLDALFREPLIIICYFIALLLISPQLTLLVLILIPVTGLVIGLVGNNLKKKSLNVQQQFGNLLAIIEETVSGIRIVKAFNALASSEKKFTTQNKSYIKQMTSIYRRRDLASPLSEFLGASVFVVVLWFGGKLVMVNNGVLNAETFIAYLAIFSQIINPAKSFSQVFYSIRKGLASVERVKQVLDAAEVIVEKPDAKAISTFENEIEFKNVGFAYEEKLVLSDINLTIKKGQTIAIVGSSGGGKSSLINLLPRFYDCTHGEIFIDGNPITDLKINELRGLIGIVSQEPILFNDSIFNNIAFGTTGISEANVIEAAKIANAHDFILEAENGYQTQIGDRGNKLSGGQKQRISIARAILKNPPILLLDEATSALDTESERQVQDALTKLMQNRTSVVIAHRLSTIQNADEIIVIQEGYIVERGNHQSLSELNGVYKKLCSLQTFQ